MSQETSRWLNQNTLVGFTDKRGRAWHYRASDQGAEPNHYPGPIPVFILSFRIDHDCDLGGCVEDGVVDATA